MSSAPINVRHNWSKTFWAPCPDLFIKVTARWRVLTTFVDDQFFNNSSRPFRNAFYQLAVIEWVETSLESNNFWQNVGAKTSKKNRRDGQTQRTLKVFNWFILRQISFRLLFGYQRKLSSLNTNQALVQATKTPHFVVNWTARYGMRDSLFLELVSSFEML